MRPVMTSAHGALLRALERYFETERERNLPSLRIEGLRSESWASVTFSGHRHHLDLVIGVAREIDLNNLISTLSTAELVVPGHFVADVTLIARQWQQTAEGRQIRLSFEILTIED